MKTNPIARSLLRVRFIAPCLAIVGLAVVEFGLGEYLVVRYGFFNVVPTQTQQASSLSIGDLMAAAPVVR